MLMVNFRFVCADQAIYVPDADRDFLLPVVDRIYLFLYIIVHLADLTNHDFELSYAVIRLIVQLVQRLDFFVHFFFSRESGQFPIDALNVELGAQVADFLIPKLDHIHDPVVEILSLILDQELQVLLRLPILREHLGKSLQIELLLHQLDQVLFVNLGFKLIVHHLYMGHGLVHLLREVLQDLTCVCWHFLERLISSLHIDLHLRHEFRELLDAAYRRFQL